MREYGKFPELCLSKPFCSVNVLSHVAREEFYSFESNPFEPDNIGQIGEYAV